MPGLLVSRRAAGQAGEPGPARRSAFRPSEAVAEPLPYPAGVAG